jgi:hypothetical protein
MKTMGKNSSAYGIYKTVPSVEAGVDALKGAGYRSEDISVLLPENMSNKEFAHKKETKAPEGTATGATTGAALGGALGWLVGVGALAIPGMGPFIAAGPIMAALSGVGAGGVVGGLVGAVVGMGIPEYEAKRYEGMVRDGEFSSRFIATIRTGPNGRRTFWKGKAHATSVRPARVAPIMPRPSGRY